MDAQAESRGMLTLALKARHSVRPLLKHSNPTMPPARPLAWIRSFVYLYCTLAWTSFVYLYCMRVKRMLTDMGVIADTDRLRNACVDAQAEPRGMLTLALKARHSVRAILKRLNQPMTLARLVGWPYSICTAYRAFVLHAGKADAG